METRLYKFIYHKSVYFTVHLTDVVDYMYIKMREGSFLNSAIYVWQHVMKEMHDPIQNYVPCAKQVLLYNHHSLQ